MTRNPGGMPGEIRRALRILRDAGLMERYSANDKVVLLCRHIVVIDAPVRRGGRYSSYCPDCDDWLLIVRSAKATERIGGRFLGSEQELWPKVTEDDTSKLDTK